MWPSDGVGDLRERLPWCRSSVPNGGGLPLRHEEEHGGSIVFDFMCETSGNEICTPISMDSY